MFNALSNVNAQMVPFSHPVLNVRLIKSQYILNNDYNPNKVAPPEFRLLRHSIIEDGMTMPVVVGKESHDESFVIIDGYHRSQLLKNDDAIHASLGGYAPVVVLQKSMDKRISSSVRHNMARGAHQVELTAQLVMRL